MENEDKMYKIRHSLAHLLAAAVLGKDPNTKLGIGPVIENGFYYDIQTSSPLSEQQLPGIEKRMREMIKQNLAFERGETSAQEAKELFKNQPFKLELIEELSKNIQPIITYKTAAPNQQSNVFIDLCAGPHINSVKEINPEAFKLTKIAGAYWRGSEKNPMLTRIYGVAFADKKELMGYIKLQEEIKGRDHRKLGMKMDLFTFSPLVGSGLPMFTPKGTLLRDLVVKKIQDIQNPYGFQKVWIPHIAKKELYQTSGHWEKFKEDLFHVKGKSDTQFVMKPMNCPHHTQIYASLQRSYKDLPIRYAEVTTNYRDEQPGELLGLSRVRSLTQDDGHVFCTPEQVEKEIKNIIKVIKQFYKLLNMFRKNDYWVSLSIRDLKNPEKYLGNSQNWSKAEKALEQAAESEKLDYKKIEGEAAFYGPKLDFMFKDALGREWQLATIQLDLNMPERFALKYKDENGIDKTPVMIHRAIAGSLERFLSVIIEHFDGAFPLWLSPEQVWVLPIGKQHKKYSKEVAKKLKEAGIRVIVKEENETLGKKIREGQIQKIPYLLIVGDKEMKSKSVAVRHREKGDLGAKKLTAFIKQISQEIENKR